MKQIIMYILTCIAFSCLVLTCVSLILILSGCVTTPRIQGQDVTTSSGSGSANLAAEEMSFIDMGDVGTAGIGTLLLGFMILSHRRASMRIQKGNGE